MFSVWLVTMNKKIASLEFSRNEPLYDKMSNIRTSRFEMKKDVVRSPFFIVLLFTISFFYNVINSLLEFVYMYIATPIFQIIRV